MPPYPDPRPSGTSLLELLITLAAGSILLLFAAPSFRHTIANGERTAAINEFVTALHVARREANTRAEEVVVCKSADGENCAFGSDATWTDGLLVFANLNRDAPPRLNETEPVLLRTTPMRGVSIHGNRDAFVLRPHNRRSTNGTLTVCDRRGTAHARAIIVSYTGRPRTASTAPNGEPLQCQPA